MLCLARRTVKRSGVPYLKKQRVPEDPWGRVYRYRAPGEYAPFEIWSLGADDKPGGEDDDADIESWR